MFCLKDGMEAHDHAESQSNLLIFVISRACPNFLKNTYFGCCGPLGTNM